MLSFFGINNDILDVSLLYGWSWITDSPWVNSEKCVLRTPYLRPGWEKIFQCKGANANSLPETMAADATKTCKIVIIFPMWRKISVYDYTLCVTMFSPFHEIFILLTRNVFLHILILLSVKVMTQTHEFLETFCAILMIFWHPGSLATLEYPTLPKTVLSKPINQSCHYILPIITRCYICGKTCH